MAKLYFYYSSMNAGKTTMLLQSNYNYNERGMNTLLFTPKIDNRYQIGKITSRIGLEADAEVFDDQTDLFKITQNITLNNHPIHCVLIDEAQFLSDQQIIQISNIVDNLNIPVLAYGLRTDSNGNCFTGSQRLLAWADNLIEIKTVCHCGKKATHVLRLNHLGEVINNGEQVHIGGNDTYSAVCRKHFKERLARKNPKA